ncbi:MAG: hypothetical protein IPK26_09350 [Planctomycetes bacterium]|nr:hypothetical protein [Planctomycetota bacterium]
MTTFVLVHGSGQNAACWTRVAAHLRALGHHAIAPELPKTAADMGLAAHAAVIAHAVPDADTVVVAHSLCGALLPLVPTLVACRQWCSSPVTYHGVFAPAAGQPDLVVPGSPKSAAFGRRGCRGESGGGGGTSGDAGGGQESWPDLEPTPLRVVPHAPRKRRRGGRYYRWAELLRRVFWAEVMVCPHCGADRRLLTAIHDPSTIREILIGPGLAVWSGSVSAVPLRRRGAPLNFLSAVAGGPLFGVAVATQGVSLVLGD